MEAKVVVGDVQDSGFEPSPLNPCVCAVMEYRLPFSLTYGKLRSLDLLQTHLESRLLGQVRDFQVTVMDQRSHFARPVGNLLR